jgi:hypothetical protein
MDILPTDLWNIVLQYKRDMELLTHNTHSTNRFLRYNLLPCYTKYMLETLVENIAEFPFHIMYDYIEARAVYRERLAVWGIYDALPPPDFEVFPMLL